MITLKLLSNHSHEMINVYRNIYIFVFNHNNAITNVHNFKDKKNLKSTSLDRKEQKYAKMPRKLVEVHSPLTFSPIRALSN